MWIEIKHVYYVAKINDNVNCVQKIDRVQKPFLRTWPKSNSSIFAGLRAEHGNSEYRQKTYFYLIYFPVP